MPTLIRQTFRRLLRERGFTVTVLLTLALCIGANVAIFAVVDAVIVRPLPFAEPNRLVIVRNSYPGAGAEISGASFVNYYDRRHAIKAFSSVALQQDGGVIVGDEGSPNRVSIGRVTPEFFATLGVPLLMGRTFTDAELLYGPDAVAILTNEYWHTHYNADPNILGKKFLNDGLPVTIVGVLTPHFQFLSSKASFFRPASHGPDDIKPNARHNNSYMMIARLAPGASIDEAQAQMDAFNQVQLKDDPYAELVRNAHYHTFVHSLHADHVRDVRPILLILQAGVLSLLLIGGVNLVNLLLIRANGRAKEYAVRQALGAGRRHLLREILLETILLALAGGVLGVLAGMFGIDLLVRLGTDRLPLGGTIAFDSRVAWAALAVSLAVGVLLALPIVFVNVRSRLAPVLHSESRSGTVSRAAQRLRHGFIVAQIAIAFVLLAGAGLLGLSLMKVLSVSPGFRADHVLVGTVSLPWKTYPEPANRLAFFDRLYTTLKSQPGVTTVGFGTSIPLTGNDNNNAITVEGFQRAPGESIRTHYTSFAMGDYWNALGIPLLEGRLLEPADNHREQKVCVVDQDFARRYWPNGSALGHRIANDVSVTDKTSCVIVGVVGNVKHLDLADTNAQGAVYFTYQTYSVNSVEIAIRTPLAPEAMADILRRTVLSIDPGLPVDDIRSMQTVVNNSLVSRRSPAVLAGAFAVVALLLAAVGTYGVLAYAVGQRRREIGVRMALGALPAQVLRQFLGLGIQLLAIGIVLGTILAWLVGWAMQSVLFGVGSVNPGVLAATAGLMITVVLVATFIPSQRATRVSPIEALRTE
ncbi:MAG TPA: ABC transporter permease [Candidatus Didemnitutus sp.]|nr:ABC transporter permease [Candidatus Didemnitutus sp.]